MSKCTKRSPFSDDTKRKALLWSDRHCCLCGKLCGTDIEIAHLADPDDNKIENAIPLCYDCHAEIGRYNDEHPRGNKYKPEELEARRDQIYERYTRHLVPPLKIGLGPIAQQSDPDKPRVSTRVTHLSDSNPIQLRLIMRAFFGSDDKGLINSNYYNGEILWNLTPRLTVTGGFRIPKSWIENARTRNRLRIEVNNTIIDIYEREHPQLPFCYSYVKNSNSWNYEPTSYKELSRSWRNRE